MIFDEWLTSIFDHPVTQPEWYWEADTPFWEGPATTMSKYMTRLFAEAETVLNPFSDAQAAQGLYAIISNSMAGYPSLLLDKSVPLRSCLDCVEAIETLFRCYFAERCSPHLSHLDTAETGTPPHINPLNGVCYMWWDVLPLHGLSRNRPDYPDGPVLDKTILSVIQNCLKIDSVACQESAVLGLFEWSPYYNETSKIAEDFLSRNPDIRPELRAFTLKYLIGI